MENILEYIKAHLPSTEERMKILEGMNSAERWEQLKKWYLPDVDTMKGGEKNE